MGQRAAKLLGVKVGGFKKKSATLSISVKMCACASTWVQLRLGSNHSQSLTDSNFVDPILPVWKDLNPLSKYVKVHEADSI